MATQQRVLVHPSFVTTTEEFAGYSVVQSFGLVRGLTVRNPNVGKAIFASFSALGGGENSVYMEMCEKARETALQRLCEHAGAKGANAVVGMYYDTNEIAEGMTEVLAYGTAVAIQTMTSTNISPNLHRDNANRNSIGSETRIVNPILASLVNSHLLIDAGVDTESRSILVLVSCFLPDPNVTNYDDLLQLSVDKMGACWGSLVLRLNRQVEQGYVLVVFSSGSRYRPSMGWVMKTYKHLERKFRKNLKKLFIVHPSPWLKLMMQVMGPVISPKFRHKIEWVHNIAALEQFVPVENIKIPKIILDIDKQQPNLQPRPSTAGSLISSLASWVLSSTGINSVLPVNTNDQFGVSLDVLMGPQGEKGIPRVVDDCIRFILLQGLETEGLFRVSPGLHSVNALREKYNLNEENISIEAFGGVHSACGLLKLFFRDLPRPIFEGDMYDSIRVIQTFNELDPTAHQIAYARNALLQILPMNSFILLRCLFHLLRIIHESRETTLMNAGNLAIVWSPNFVKSANPMVDLGMCAVGANGGGIGTLVKLCIEHWDEVFSEPTSVYDNTSEENISVFKLQDQNNDASVEDFFHSLPHSLPTPPDIPPIEVASETAGSATIDSFEKQLAKSYDALKSEESDDRLIGLTGALANSDDSHVAEIPVSRARSPTRRSPSRGGANRNTIVAENHSTIARFGGGLSQNTLSEASRLGVDDGGISRRRSIQRD
ncbi:hypothetical protein HK100_008587 [Physocladia obscura]|uniref:Uncharacterized protein n=1 Tax=Physocladia obscura TaxID=109957 RepID=A0AAD5XEJ9_9FUNG|nr:hypothetical protein HK100_008587 [Physocladia obscura]